MGEFLPGWMMCIVDRNGNLGRTCSSPGYGIPAARLCCVGDSKAVVNTMLLAAHGKMNELHILFLLVLGVLLLSCWFTVS